MASVPPPLASVIIAVRNAAAYLGACLDSVSAQTFDDFEILVIDGQSVDATEAIARSCARVRFLQQPGKGFANAWNWGLRNARGELIAFIDSDDRWAPNKLAGQVAMLREQPELEGVIGKVRFFLEPGETPARGFREDILGEDHLAHMPGALLARRRLFDHIGDWGEDWVIANDIDWFVKLKDSGLPIGILDEVVLHKRVHARNLSYLTAADPVYPSEVLRALRASILRKRAAGRTKDA